MTLENSTVMGSSVKHSDFWLRFVYIDDSCEDEIVHSICTFNMKIVCLCPSNIYQIFKSFWKRDLHPPLPHLQVFIIILILSEKHCVRVIEKNVEESDLQGDHLEYAHSETIPGTATFWDQSVWIHLMCCSRF